MEIEYFSREKLTKIFQETSEERFTPVMVAKSSLCDHDESSKFGNSILFPILLSIFEAAVWHTDGKFLPRNSTSRHFLSL